MIGDSTDARRTTSDEFVRLLGQYKVQLYGYIFCMVRSTQDAEDVFQQASLTMWNKLGDFQPGTDFLAWASTIARYKALEFLRDNKRKRTEVFSEALIEELPVASLWSPTDLAQRLEALERCREKLSTANQRLLALCYEGRGAISEAARKLGRPVSSVYASLSRLRRMLHECIQKALSSENGT